ncbi:hypothetical protein RclHR1_26490002 [Rhizophagus clarus]|uniref:BTB/POZ protein n=1 Tax=Rhizophagus clarus TaxID=94130 RepID=A0A2Z6REE0_9GLOM|nr:hypothetical protein RclHR1_26490002 [Rhizophagus clarus]GES92237.1 BTB/POZ protein [Rhizophagus clarus]
MVDYKFLLKLSQNLLDILNDDEFYDVTIEVGIDPYIKIFRAHTIVLYHRSSHFQKILSTDIKKKNDGTLTQVKLPNVSPEIFQIILRYIYGGRISLEECDAFDIIKILGAANELNLQELTTYIQSFLIKNKAKWLEENFDIVYQKSFENITFLELQKFCNDLISEEPVKIFKSPNFTSISEELLLTLIQNDYLEMSEIQIWEQVIKWGIAQNPELPSSFTNYSKDELKTLKKTLQQCIPFIRFYNLSSGEFMDNVLPYKKLLPKELYEDLLKTFLSLLDPNSKPSNKSMPRKFKHNKSRVSLLNGREKTSKWMPLADTSLETDKFVQFSFGKKTSNFPELSPLKANEYERPSFGNVPSSTSLETDKSEGLSFDKKTSNMPGFGTSLGAYNSEGISFGKKTSNMPDFTSIETDKPEGFSFGKKTRNMPGFTLIETDKSEGFSFGKKTSNMSGFTLTETNKSEGFPLGRKTSNTSNMLGFGTSLETDKSEELSFDKKTSNMPRFISIETNKPKGFSFGKKTSNMPGFTSIETDKSEGFLFGKKTSNMPDLTSLKADETGQPSLSNYTSKYGSSFTKS